MEGTAGIRWIGAAGGGPVVNTGRKESTVLIHVSLTLIIALPIKWDYFVIQLG
jgi:hypothetical protein